MKCCKYHADILRTLCENVKLWCSYLGFEFRLWGWFSPAWILSEDCDRNNLEQWHRSEIRLKSFFSQPFLKHYSISQLFQENIFWEKKVKKTFYLVKIIIVNIIHTGRKLLIALTQNTILFLCSIVMNYLQTSLGCLNSGIHSIQNRNKSNKSNKTNHFLSRLL